MDLISETLHYLGRNKKDIFVVQIGAMDGITFDDTREFLDIYKWKALLIEPIPEIFEKLKENFKNVDNYIYEQSAIVENDGPVEMLTIPYDIIEKENLHHGYKGMSSVYPLKNGFGSNFQRDIEVKEKFGVNITVPGITFKTLCEKHNIKKIDILLCDAEGYDWKIFNQLDFSKYRPSFIRLELLNLTEEEKKLTIQKLEDNDYIIETNSSNIDATDKTLMNEIISNTTIKEVTKNLTVVTGLWNIGRNDRSFDHYIERFKEFLEIPANLFIYIPKELENIVWEKRNKENTYIKIADLDYIKHMYQPFWGRTQEIRTNPKWYNTTGENGWLKTSPQATLEWYDPIVQSKMFLLNDATIWDPFNTEYFIWLDAGITNTVDLNHFKNNRVLDKIIPYLSDFLFLSYPYIGTDEIHGFNLKVMNRYAGDDVKYVCRGGLFGGKKEIINQANATYYTTLDRTLNDGCLGTEESIFTIMSYREPHIYRRYMLDDNGLIIKFTQALIDNNVELVPVSLPKTIKHKIITNGDLEKVKTNLYILTFNFPEQLQFLLTNMEKTSEWLTKPHLVLMDNSTDENISNQNKEIAEKYNFEYVWLGRNTGICGGRQSASNHFHDSDADFMLFFQDDMTINSKDYEGQFCRNGFRKYVPNLYDIIHKIMLKEEFDFLKLSFTEVYFDNDKALPWYNVPQHIRTRDWPDYDKLPITGLDPNSPPTKYEHVKILDGLAYLTGEINYSDWPMIQSKEGNKKMFIDTTWAHPYEQTWSSHIYQLTKEGKINSGILLASPIWHERIKYYKPEERREN